MKYLQPDWPAPDCIRAFTTVRQSWSGRDHESLKTIFNLPAEPVWLKQVHGTIALPAEPENREKTADASFTYTPEQVCVVLTADCLPVLVTNQKGSCVAAIHAGWRGLSAGIIEKTIDELKQPGDALLAWLGPAIGPSRFEVGLDVYQAFTDHHAESATAFRPISDSKWLANLYELAKIRLHSKGISRIYGGDFCTYTQDDLFFSYRRNKGERGRMASVIWINR